MEIVLYTDKECMDVLTEMKKKPECIRIMSFTDYGNISVIRTHQVPMHSFIARLCTLMHKEAQ